MNEFDSDLSTDFGFGTADELALLSARGGHDEAAALALFRRLRGPQDQLRGGDATALRDHLVMTHAPLVEHCARKFLGSGEPLEDLVQEGYVGLIKAVDRFDPNAKNKFSTYACHLISGEIRHYLRDLGRLIHEPGWHFELRQRITKVSDGLSQQLGRDPEAGEIAAALNVKVETVRDVLKNRRVLHVESLDTRPENESGDEMLSLLERLDQNRESASEGEHAQVEDQLFLEEAMPQLKELEQQALRLFFFEEKSKSDIARQLEISVNYAAYLIKRGMETLRGLLEASEPALSFHSPASQIAQSQARAAYLLELARSEAQSDPRRTFKPQERVPAMTKPGVASLTQFTGWLDEEIARAGRYGGDFSVLWFQIRNWDSVTQNLKSAEKKSAAAAASVLVRRQCRGVDRVAAFATPDPPGLQFLVLLPATGAPGNNLGQRLMAAFSNPDLPLVEAALHARFAHAMFPADGRIGEEIFADLGKKLGAAT